MCYQQSTLAENFIVYHGLPVHSIPSYDHTETGITLQKTGLERLGVES